jgi:hypothetical protein
MVLSIFRQGHSAEENKKVKILERISKKHV